MAVKGSPRLRMRQQDVDGSQIRLGRYFRLLEAGPRLVAAFVEQSGDATCSVHGRIQRSLTRLPSTAMFAVSATMRPLPVHIKTAAVALPAW